MSGYLLAFGVCWSCKRRFTFDPDRVCSLPIDPVTNLPADMGGDPSRVVAQPVCLDCITRANENRKANGRYLIVVLPGAYGEA